MSNNNRMGSDFPPPQKPIRRGQLFGPWGVGAIVPFPNDESLMIAGLDMWEYKNPNAFVIKEERLTSRLGIKELRRPPDYRDPRSDRENSKIRLPAVRFPRWHYCPYCGLMRKVSYFTTGELICKKYPWQKGRSCYDKNIKRRLIPERFIVACPEGHIDDFPVAEWLHELQGGQYNPETCYIRRSTGGLSTSLSGVRYECTCGAARSMTGATNPGALSRVYQCRGSKPWLGIDENPDNICGNQGVRVIQRGGTNVWFADVVSSIYIPTFSNSTDEEKINKIVKKALEIGIISYVNGMPDLNSGIIDHLTKQNGVNPEALLNAFKKQIFGTESIENDKKEISENEYRNTEYKVLCNSYKDDEEEFISINQKINEYDSLISKFFNSISLVPVLRETRALVGFSRLEPSLNMSYREKKKMLRRGDDSWLPANDTFGEGIFIEFDSKSLEKWRKSASVINRVKILESHFTSKYSRFQMSESGLNPAYVLLHTFSHIIINQLAYECGYGSSSIRERIYCTQNDEKMEMNGVLIYTASGDSEGTLGGLVKQGEPGRLENTILSALENARWCSSDPICIESTGQGPDSCNLAACHNCALLPETCCETGNRLLDRGLLIGDQLGYFNTLFEG